MEKVDVLEIERQHQEMVHMLNRLNDAVKKRVAREEIYRIIDQIIAFTRQHFTTEEQLMVQSGYPEIEVHKVKHAELIQDALHLKGKLEYVGDEMFTECRSLAVLQSARAYSICQQADQRSRYSSWRKEITLSCCFTRYVIHGSAARSTTSTPITLARVRLW